MTFSQIAELGFWASLLGFAHSYVVYPLLLFVWFRLRRRPGDDARSMPERPSLSLIVSAYNEEAVIRAKAENMLALRYPKESLELVIASDGSTDRTVAIADAYRLRGIRVLAYGDRRGKPGTLNRAVAETDGEILVFSDANTLLDPSALENLARHFGAPNVGAVCGELMLHSRGGESPEEEQYWRYERTLKKMESALGTALGANGGIYAIRRSLFDPVPEDTLIDDFVIPMRVVERGLRVVYDPEAVAHEETAPGAVAEFRRRVRIGAGGFQAIVMLRSLLNPRRGFVAFAFFSHKVLRWLGPFLLLAMLGCSLLLASRPTYALAAAAQATLYVAAAWGAVLERAGRTGGPFRRPFYFVMINVALFAGCLRWALGRQPAAWERTERRSEIAE